MMILHRIISEIFELHQSFSIHLGSNFDLKKTQNFINTSRAHKHPFAGQYLVDSQTQNIPKTKYFPGKIVEFNKFFFIPL